MGYFHASKLLKLAFLPYLTRKYVLWKGFYHDFSTKKASAGLFPLDPRRGRCPLDPQGSFAPPPNDLPWRRPCFGWSWLGQKKKLFACPRPTDHLVRPDCKRFLIFSFFKFFSLKFKTISSKNATEIAIKVSRTFASATESSVVYRTEYVIINIHDYHFRGRKYRCKHDGRYGYNGHVHARHRSTTRPEISLIL